MSEAGALLHAILHGDVADESEALLHLDMALALEVEPLDYCSRRLGLGEETVLQRAAAWADLPFATHAPATVPGSAAIDRIERLGEIRSLRAQQPDREIVYCAPRFAEFLALARHLRRHPELRSQLCVVPESAIRAELAEANQEALLDEARQRLSRKWPRATGSLELSKAARSAFVAGIGGLVLLAALAPILAEAVLVPIIAALLAIPAGLRLWAAIAPPPVAPRTTLLDDAELPAYTVLLPLRDEARMVRQLSEAMRALDYPPEKLRVYFLVETRSPETVAAAKAELHDPRFELVLVPDALPRTKPKALNYALPFVTGAHVVVYDAEDIPDRDQLRLAASTFAKRPDLDCLQAELVVDNANETWLTALFAGEYAGQFGLLLPLLARLGLPMPLGGTSNHFRVDTLRRIGGWDPFNVTEDADLGVRLARLRLRTETLDSRTAEEAPISLRAWLKQRTRWMKGWMQTAIVHNRRPREFLTQLGWRGFLGFQIYVGSMIISAPLHTAFVSSFLISQFLPQGPIDIWDAISAAIFIIGYGGPAALVIAGLLRLGRRDLLARQLWLPVYWVLHSAAALLALHELLTRPYFWAKTEHGRTRYTREGQRAGPPAQPE